MYFNSLKELDEFIEEAEKGLNQPLVEGDYETLISVMGYLKRVKERQIETDNMFEPLKEIIELVKTYDMDFPEETYILLQVSNCLDGWGLGLLCFLFVKGYCKHFVLFIFLHKFW